MTNSIWFLKGLRKGILTEKFPIAGPAEPPLWPSMLSGNRDADCPTKAIENGKWNQDKCIFCRKCIPVFKPTGKQEIFDVRIKTEKMFKRSIYLYPIDSGTCGACNAEFFSIFSPQYDANRLNIFMTNTPRHADAIVIMGVYSDGMKDVLVRAYEAMPDPKIIIALGACALSGGIMGREPDFPGNLSLKIAGCPPSPYTILDAIYKLRGK